MRANSSPAVSEDRRVFLISAAATGAAAVLSGSLLSACATAISYRGDLSNGRVRIPAQQLSLIADQPGLLVDAPGLPEKIWLIRAEDEWLAIGAQCTHLKCQVRPRGGFISCNCHGSTFQIDGRVIRGPASKPLRRYVVQVVKTLTDDTTHDVEIMIQ